MTNDVPASTAPPPTASQLRVRATLESIFNASIDLHCDVTGEALISLPDDPVRTVWPLRAPRVRFWLAERCWQETRDFARKSELDGMLNILARSACRTPRRPVDNDELARLMDLHPFVAHDHPRLPESHREAAISRSQTSPADKLRNGTESVLNRKIMARVIRLWVRFQPARGEEASPCV